MQFWEVPQQSKNLGHFCVANLWNFEQSGGGGYIIQNKLDTLFVQILELGCTKVYQKVPKNDFKKCPKRSKPILDEVQKAPFFQRESPLIFTYNLVWNNPYKIERYMSLTKKKFSLIPCPGWILLAINKYHEDRSSPLILTYNLVLNIQYNNLDIYKPYRNKNSSIVLSYSPPWMNPAILAPSETGYFSYHVTVLIAIQKCQNHVTKDHYHKSGYL